MRTFSLILLLLIFFQSLRPQLVKCLLETSVGYSNHISSVLPCSPSPRTPVGLQGAISPCRAGLALPRCVTVRKVTKAPARCQCHLMEGGQALCVSSRLFGNIQGLPLLQGPCLLTYRPRARGSLPVLVPVRSPSWAWGHRAKGVQLLCASPRLTQQFCILPT